MAVFMWWQESRGRSQRKWVQGEGWRQNEYLNLLQTSNTLFNTDSTLSDLHFGHLPRDPFVGIFRCSSFFRKKTVSYGHFVLIW